MEGREYLNESIKMIGGVGGGGRVMVRTWDRVLSSVA